jgi:hypothetical protein
MTNRDDSSGVPFLDRLSRREHVLFAGAGGGFDVFSAIPLAEWARARGQRVSLANLSFTNLAEVDGKVLAPGLVAIDHESSGPLDYFPEGKLATWLHARGAPSTVHCFEKTGCRPLLHAYRTLIEALSIDAVVLVDGGTDILMRGDEAGLGTPQEDVTSLAAVNALDVAEKLVVCLGFGIDTFHGVCHAHFLRNVAALAQEGAYLGVRALLPDQPESRAFLDAVELACRLTPRRPSIVSLSIAAALRGEFGDVALTERTSGSKLFINPLMSMYWGFDLGGVARRCQYLDRVRETESVWDVNLVIEAHRQSVDVQSWEELPF